MKTMTLGDVLIWHLNADVAINAQVKQNTIVWQGIVSVPATVTVDKGERNGHQTR